MTMSCQAYQLLFDQVNRKDRFIQAILLKFFDAKCQFAISKVDSDVLTKS